MRSGVLASARVEALIPLGTYEDEVLRDGPFSYFPLGEAAGPPIDQMGAVVPDTYNGVNFGLPGLGDRPTSVGIATGTGTIGVRMPVASFAVPSAGATFEILARMDLYTSGDEAFRWSGVADLRVSGTVDAVQAYWGGTTSGFTIGSNYVIPGPLEIHHWAITWDGSTARLYDNGVQVRSQSRPGPTPASTQVGIGCDPAVTNRQWNGQLAGFAYYSTKALSAGRILAHAQAAGVA